MVIDKECQANVEGGKNASIGSFIAVLRTLDLHIIVLPFAVRLITW